MKEIKAIIFDFNGVIVNDEKLHYLAIKKVCHEYNLDLNEKDYSLIYPGQLAREIFADLIKKAGKIDSSERQCVEKKNHYYELMIDKGVLLFPGVKKFILNCQKEKFKTAIASATEKKFIYKILDKHKLLHFFQVIISGDDVIRGKPAPDIYNKAGQLLKIPNERCLVIEDSIFGLKAAKAAGMKCVAVTNTLPSQQLKNADIVINSLEGLTINNLLIEIKKTESE